MALAHRLNELALANQDGLLNDDEYRLLRQNVFEQYSTPTPVMPPAPPRPTPPPAATPARPKQSVSSTVASLLRRATGRLAPSTRNAPQRRLAPLHTDIRPSLVPSIPPLPSSPPPASPPHPYPDRPMPDPSSPLRDVFDESALHAASPADLRAAIAATEHEAARLADAFADLERSTLRRIRKRRARRLPLATPTSVDVLLEGREWREHRLAPSPSSPLFDAPAARVRGYALDARPADGVSIRSGSSRQTSRSALSASRSVSSLPRSSPAPPMSPSASASSSTPFHFRIPTLATARTRLSRRGSLASVVSSSQSQSQSPPPARATGKLSAPPSQYHPPPPSGSTGMGTGTGTALARSSSYLGLRRLVGGASSETLGAPRPGPSTASATPTGSAVYLPLPPSAPAPRRTRTRTSDDGDGDGYSYERDYRHGHGYNSGSGAGPDTDEDDPDADPDADPDDTDDATALRDIRRRREDLVARYTARLDFLRAKLRGAEIQERLRRR